MSELAMQKSNPTKEHKDKPSKKNAMLIANINICKDVAKRGDYENNRCRRVIKAYQR